MKVDLHPCFILHQRAFRETSVILDVFSSGHGRVSVVARGAKRGKNSQSILLQPGRKLNLAWAMRTEMGTLVTVELAGLAGSPVGSRLFCCFYMNELLIRMLHKHESHPELFHKYEDALIQLQGNAAEDRVLRIFEKHLLKTLGYGLVLDHDVSSGQAIDPEAAYYYQLDSGPQLDKPQDAHVPVSGRTLLALDNEQAWDKQIAREAKQLFRAILDGYTGDRPLASRELYRSYLQNSANND
jgi:DNA repair protein RecO (recombination protein O)